MVKLIPILKFAVTSSLFAMIASCSSGFDYNPSTSTLTIVPGDLMSFKDLRPNENADQLFATAQNFENEKKASKALKTFKSITKEFPLSTKAPDAQFRIAQYYEKAGKRDKAFKAYQTLISEYVGTPLYQASLERQIDIAHKSALGTYKNTFLGMKSNIPATTVDTLIAQILQNAPFAESAPHSSYLKGYIWQKEKMDARALANFRNVARKYPESNYAGEALFQMGSILHKQSLQGNTNLDNSKRALETFDELLTLYPNHPKAAEAKKLKSKIAGYDVRRSLEVAEFYDQKKQTISAIFYYNEVIKNTPPNSDLHKKSQARVTELQNTSAN